MINVGEQRLCWICREEPANSREHIIKKSDIKTAYGIVNESDQLVYTNSEYDDKRENKHSRYKLSSIDSKVLKTKKVICRKCNDTLSQPYDRAWEQFSSNLKRYLSINARPKRIPENLVLSENSTNVLQNVHLFFVKLFGCYIAHLDIPIDTYEFARSVVSATPNSNVYLEFGLWSENLRDQVIGIGGIEAKEFNGKIVLATFVYDVADFAVVVTYSALPLAIKNSSLWHPDSRIRKPRLVVLDAPRN